jgi:N-acetylglucosaminyl-diphospho-decaprenol L-rhamnosyltransferase
VSTTVVIPTHNGAARLERLLDSLGGGTNVLIADNDSSDGTRELLARRFPDVDVYAFARNVGFGRAVNEAVRRIDTDSFVLLNDDCVCEPGFVSKIAAALDPARSVVMAAGVLLEVASGLTTIDSAGIELDRTLLVFDYLNGQPVEALEHAEPPVGPSGAAAAFDREAFLAVGGFDEAFFAYWEDVDLALRLRLAGAECALAPGARAVHQHSATLGSGSARKNYLSGYGRGYVLRKWGVLSPRRTLRIAVEDGLICLGQVAIDRNLQGLRGRVAGWRAARARFPYPGAAFSPHTVSIRAQLQRRRLRRRRLAETSGR